MKKFHFEKEIIPDKLILGDEIFKITKLDKKYIIKNFDIYTDNNYFLNKIILNGIHPNYDSKNRLFCVPDFLKNIKLDKKIIEIIINMLKVFNFNSSFYQPFGDLEYEKQRKI